MNALVDELAKEDLKLKRVMLGALKNVRPTHLMDKTIARREGREPLGPSTSTASPRRP